VPRSVRFDLGFASAARSVELFGVVVPVAQKVASGASALEISRRGTVLHAFAMADMGDGCWAGRAVGRSSSLAVSENQPMAGLCHVESFQSWEGS